MTRQCMRCGADLSKVDTPVGCPVCAPDIAQWGATGVRAMSACGRCDALRRSNDALRGLVATIEALSRVAYEHWDADRDAKVGKILGAMGGTFAGYSLALDAARQSVTSADEGQLR
jgi:hypothetical protein